MPDVNEVEIQENAPLPDLEIERERNEEAADAPRAPDALAERLQENTAASPADAGGDVDAEWEEVNTSGEEAVFGSNPTPDQSDVEANAHAMGIDFQDNEPLDILEKLEKRDRDRWELDEGSKESGDMI
jgi:hypothetical protein